MIRTVVWQEYRSSSRGIRSCQGCYIVLNKVGPKLLAPSENGAIMVSSATFKFPGGKLFNKLKYWCKNNRGTSLASPRESPSRNARPNW